MIQIVWDGDPNDNNQQVDVNESSFLLSVDGTHCRVQEPRSRPNKNWYSHKHHKPCVAYEIGIHLFQSRIVWVNGSFEAGDSDLNIFRKPDGLREKIPANNLVIGDKGYLGDNIISTPNRLDNIHVKQFKKRARARHEDVNGRIKTFAILSERFRHAIPNHKIVFEAVCVITQYNMENGHPLFEI